MRQSFDVGIARDGEGIVRRERAIAVALVLGGQDRRETLEHLDELIQLADTAGADVVDQVIQPRARPDTATWIGKGKAQHLAAVVDELGADLILADDDLSPAQARNLEKLAGRPVVDRSGLILDIFARRARTREARTQVELAQLTYLLPRLTRAWSHLERQQGGIGLRGPGETQLETDRRLVRTRIRQLQEELKQIDRQRDTRRKGREDAYKVALVGYTNVGKSTLLNRLTGSAVLVEDRLFATLDATVRRLRLEDGNDVLLSDTVGFIRKLPHHLVASFRSTLREAAEADLLLHVVDISHPHMENQIRTVREVLQDLGAGETPVLHVFNKADLVEDPALLRRSEEWSPSVLVSATQGLRLDTLLKRVEESRGAGQRRLVLLVPWDRQEVAAQLRSAFRVLDHRSTPEGGLYLLSLPADSAADLIRPFTKKGARIEEKW
ncbi:MAG: GTPase HflX [bacterium]|jgi:GTP-binding protein HflX|nr:GTPase HflX [bacterium]